MKLRIKILSTGSLSGFSDDREQDIKVMSQLTTAAMGCPNEVSYSYLRGSRWPVIFLSFPNVDGWSPGITALLVSLTAYGFHGMVVQE